jgi:hypothetical protein
MLRFFKYLWECIRLVGDLQTALWIVPLFTALFTFVWSFLRKLPAPTIFVLSLGAFAFSLFIVKLIRSWLNPEIAASEHSHASPREPKASISLPITVPPLISQSQHDDRIIVEVTPEYFGDFFARHTEIQATKMVENYIGKWMRVSGQLSNASAYDYGFSIVTLQNSSYLHMIFRDKKLIDRISVMVPKQPITIMGQITNVSTLSLRLDNCEIINN